MAEGPSAQGIEVSLTGHGKPLLIHSCEAVGDQRHKSPIDAITKTRFIEGIPGADFTVSMLTKKPYKFISSTLVYHIEIDGVHVVTNVLKKKAYEQMGNRFQMHADRAQQGTARRAIYTMFRFAEDEITDVVVKVFARGAIRGTQKATKRPLNALVAVFHFLTNVPKEQSQIFPRTPSPKPESQTQVQFLTPRQMVKTSSLPLSPPASTKRQRQEDDDSKKEAAKKTRKESAVVIDLTDL